MKILIDIFKLFILLITYDQVNYVFIFFRVGLNFAIGIIFFLNDLNCFGFTFAECDFFKQTLTKEFQF